MDPIFKGKRSDIAILPLSERFALRTDAVDGRYVEMKIIERKSHGLYALCSRSAKRVGTLRRLKLLCRHVLR